MMRKFRLAEPAHPESWECKIFLARPPAPITHAVLETVEDIMHRLWILEEEWTVPAVCCDLRIASVMQITATARKSRPLCSQSPHVVQRAFPFRLRSTLSGRTLRWNR